MSKPLNIENTISIHAPIEKVWDVLVNPEQTKKYMYGCETVSDWKPGSQLLWRGNYEGKETVFVHGTVVRIDPPALLEYTVFDSLSSMVDIPENHLHVVYKLSTEGEYTILHVTQGDYSTVAEGEKRYAHSFNKGEGWNPVLIEIKKVAEA